MHYVRVYVVESRYWHIYFDKFTYKVSRKKSGINKSCMKILKKTTLILYIAGIFFTCGLFILNLFHTRDILKVSFQTTLRLQFLLSNYCFKGSIETLWRNANEINGKHEIMI